MFYIKLETNHPLPGHTSADVGHRSNLRGKKKQHERSEKYRGEFGEKEVMLIYPTVGRPHQYRVLLLFFVF